MPKPAAKSNQSQCAQARLPLRDKVHCYIHHVGDTYIAEVLEFGIVSQGDTLDETVSNIQGALSLHLEDEDLGAIGFVDRPRIQILLELPCQ
ncbi:MAG: type II toxin-antitoxin system HicB family antitoxin [Terriglobales bacterium]